MLSLDQIISYYPPHLQNNPSMCLREYLQILILKSIFASPYAHKLRFIGGTALRLVYHSQRFSEDIDFDNIDLSFDEFDALSQHIQRDLQKYGLTVLMRTVEKGAFHCNISIPEILHRSGLSPMKNQTILIQIDTHAQGYSYTPTRYILTGFDQAVPILTISPSLLLAHKCFACFERRRIKGRDFYDIVFLLGKTRQIDMDYIMQKMNIETPIQLKTYLLNRCQGVDFDALQRDVAPFLFDPTNQSVALFPDIIKQTTFE